MKTVLLVRHAEPLKHTGLPTEQIPLSENGCRMARQFLHSRLFQDVCCAYTSPYCRARETAAFLPCPATPDSRLAERALGDPTTLVPSFWVRQYADLDYKNPGGESLRETGSRMATFMQELLGQMDEGGTAVAVSHAAAICAYLCRTCTVEITDASRKLRRITLDGGIVLDGPIRTPSAFALLFQGRRLVSLTFYDLIIE